MLRGVHPVTHLELGDILFEDVTPELGVGAGSRDVGTEQPSSELAAGRVVDAGGSRAPIRPVAPLHPCATPSGADPGGAVGCVGAVVDTHPLVVEPERSAAQVRLESLRLRVIARISGRRVTDGSVNWESSGNGRQVAALQSGSGTAAPREGQEGQL